MKRWMKVSLVFVGSVLLLAVCLALWLPGILKSQAERRVEAATARKLVIGAISVNPFTLTVKARDLRFAELHGRETFLAFSSARVTLSPMLLIKGAPIISAAQVSAPRLRIVRNAADSYNFSDLLQWLPEHPRLSVNNLSVSHGSLDFIDRGMAVEQHHELRQIELAVPFLTTIPYLAPHYVTPRLSALVNGAPLRLEGRLRPFPKAVEASLSLDLTDVALPAYLAYLPKEFPVRAVSGKLSSRINLSYLAAQKRDPELVLSGAATVADLGLTDRSGAPFLNAGRLSVDIARALPLTGEIDLSSLSADALEVFLSRDGAGTWSHSRLVAGRARQVGVPRKLQVRVAQTQLRNGSVHFVDHLPKGGFRSDLSGISLNMTDYSTVPAPRAHFVLSCATSRGGRATLDGTFDQAGFREARGGAPPSSPGLQGALTLRSIPLAGLNPYLPQGLNATIASGTLDGRLQLSFSGKEQLRTGSLRGSLTVRKLHCLDAAGQELLKGERLEVDRIKAHLSPRSLEIGSVALTRFSSRVVIATDGRLNLGGLYARQPVPPEGEPEDAAGRVPIRIDRVTVTDGTLAFIDHHVAGGYASTLFDLGGRIEHISSEEDSLAEVSLRGSLEHSSPLQITGRINPLRRAPFADLRVSFTGIELPPMTPYSGTYLGYAVERGTLYLHSDYRLENSKLDWTNQVFIDQLNLGRRMASDQETALPVRLALALLKDSNGEIHLELPVSGQTDAPHFSVRNLVLEVWQKLVQLARQSPFALLRTLLGATDDWSGVEFAHGSPELSSEEQGKLLRLATALKDRPELRVNVIGYAQADEEQLHGLANTRAAGVRRFLIERGKLAAARVVLKSAGQTPVPAPERGAARGVTLEIAVE